MANVRKRYTCEEVLAVLMESDDESDEKGDLDTDEEELINEGLDPDFGPKFYGPSFTLILTKTEIDYVSFTK